MHPVGIVANPMSGRDVRRLLTNAGTSTLDDKVSVVRRVLVGAFEAGATRFIVLPEPHGVVRRALSTLPFARHLDVADAVTTRSFDERDTVASAVAMRDAGCAAVVVLGGDGTNRAVALGWHGAPVIPLSTGTNNAFPEATEATIAGAAAGHLATGVVAGEDAGTRSKVVEVDVDGEGADVALIDALLLREPPQALGSLKPFPAERMATAVLARADPTAVGVSALGGVLLPVAADEDLGAVLRFGPASGAEARTVRAPLAPGTYVDVGVTGWGPLALGEPVTVEGPGILAFDGDRRRLLAPGQGAVLRVRRNGPLVVDVGLVLGSPAVRARSSRGGGAGA